MDSREFIAVNGVQSLFSISEVNSTRSRAKPTGTKRLSCLRQFKHSIGLLILGFVLLQFSTVAWAAPPAFETQTTNTESSNVSSLELTVPSGVNAGDLLLAVIAVSDNQNFYPRPAGFCSIRNPTPLVTTLR